MQSSTGSPATDRDGSACWSDGSKDKLIDRRGPEWDCTVKEWMLWQWQATMHLNGKGYKATLEGENRDDATSGDAKVRDEYVRKNGDLFREILRMFNAKSEAGKTLMLQIQDEFDNDTTATACGSTSKHGRAA